MTLPCQMVDYLGYAAAFLGCGVIGAASAMLLWWGLPEQNERFPTTAPA